MNDYREGLLIGFGCGGLFVLILFLLRTVSVA